MINITFNLIGFNRRFKLLTNPILLLEVYCMDDLNILVTIKIKTPKTIKIPKITVERIYLGVINEKNF